MTRVAVVLLASLVAGCATGAARTAVTLPPLFVCDRAVYWYDHPPVEPMAVPRFPVPLNLLYFARPDYPYEARRKRMEGRMVLEMRIMPDGTVRQIKIVRRPRYPLLELAAKQGLRQWRFAHGAPARVRIPVTFSLRCAE